ncbi:BA14K family protein [Shinella daejeonensis]|uniref:BA14K family protein n=1 Tax=Shinella daejeonensis TaxID=659017 RepID=UPI0020C7720D|nr:BA14K family protein [Shinella daejeonensis]MCP8893969.1 BA14K family protein [Shinella daejeonensis]
MNRTLKTLVVGAALAATTLTATTGIAQARDRHWRGDDYRKPYYRHHDHRGRDAVIGGALGLATGLIVGSAIANQQPRYDERRIYVEPEYYPQPRPEPRVVYRPVAAPSYEPWTRAWYDYCSSRYRSFNPDTGTFLGYDGRTHFCEAE